MQELLPATHGWHPARCHACRCALRSTYLAARHALQPKMQPMSSKAQTGEISSLCWSFDSTRTQRFAAMAGAPCTAPAPAGHARSGMHKPRMRGCHCEQGASARAQQSVQVCPMLQHGYFPVEAFLQRRFAASESVELWHIDERPAPYMRYHGTLHGAREDEYEAWWKDC